MEVKIQSFRAEVTAIFLPSTKACLVAGFILFAAISVKDEFSNINKVFEAILMCESVIFPVTLLLMLVATFGYKITVYSDGISSYDPFGTFKCDFMTWSSMKRLRHRNIFGYEYYFVQSENYKERLWIPFKIKNKKSFTMLVQTKVGSGNPLGADLIKFRT
jgi:hypothetical protein